MKRLLVLFSSFLSLLCYSCGSSGTSSTDKVTRNPVTQTPTGETPTGGAPTGGTPPSGIQNPSCRGSMNSSPFFSQPSAFSGIVFTPVGGSFGNVQLIDLDFLPGQNGDAVVVAKDGVVYYMKNDFTPLPATVPLSVETGGEQGLLNVAADPDFVSNCFIYLYFTPPGGGINRVVRGTVQVDLASNAFSLGDLQLIIEFPKSGPDNSPFPGDNHNGGGLAFQNSENLFIGVGDGGGASSADPGANISQRGNTFLGKILRIVPSRTPGVGGYALPPSGNNTGAGVLPEIFAFGVRNPFTLNVFSGALFIGDVGAGSFEEIDLATEAGKNFGWPQVEGPAGLPNFVDPIGGYNHGTDIADHNLEDPEANPGPLGDAAAVMVGLFYTGPAYGGFLSNRLIYSEFYQGWVRAIELDGSLQPSADSHLGHLVAMTSLQEGPGGLIYSVSLFLSDQILRLDLVP